MIWLRLLYVYLKIGILGFGGGYAMLSLIQADVVDRYGWISLQEFTDIVAISQMTPGPIGINSATYIGYTAVHNAGYSETMSILGSCLTTFAVCLPSFLSVSYTHLDVYKRQAPGLQQNTLPLSGYSSSCSLLNPARAVVI